MPINDFRLGGLLCSHRWAAATVARHLARFFRLFPVVLYLTVCPAIALADDAQSPQSTQLTRRLSQLRLELAAAGEHAASETAQTAMRVADLELSESDRVLKSAASAHGSLDPHTIELVARALVKTRLACESEPSLYLERVNEQLFKVAQVLASSPYVGSTDYVLALSPIRMPEKGGDKRVTAVVLSAAGQDVQELPVALKETRLLAVKSAPGTWLVSLPTDLPLHAADTLSLHFPSVVRRLFLFTTVLEQTAQVYIEPVPLFSFRVRIHEENPEARVTVESKAQYIARADSAHAFVSQVISAPQLFTQLVGGSEFDPDSARLKDVRGQLVPGGKPCGSCPDPQGKFTVSEDQSQLLVSLSAITCAPEKLVRPFPQLSYYCGGGATSIEFRAEPSFSVLRRDRPRERTLPDRTVVLERHTTKTLFQLPPDWTSVEIAGAPVDQRQTDSLVLDHNGAATAAADSLFWHVHSDGGALEIATD